MNPKRGEIKVAADPAALASAAAEEFAQAAQSAISARGRFAVALSGGSTPLELYEMLAQAPYRTRIDWHRVEFFWGDERAVAPDHPDSNFKMANEALIAKLALNPQQVHRMQAERTDLEAAAQDYQDEIARTLGSSADSAPPSFDLTLQGLGPDGHTASLFPYTEALNETVRWVAPNYVPRLKAWRLTMTARLLNRAALVIFLVSGPDKAAPLAQVLEGPEDPQRLPAQLIRPANGRLLWLVDRAAASRLQRSLTAGSSMSES
jgi:6-phosphogluconolactonase